LAKKAWLAATCEGRSRRYIPTGPQLRKTDICGAEEVADEAALAKALRLYFTDPALLRRSGRATQEAVERFGGATTRIMQALEPWLAGMQAEKR